MCGKRLGFASLPGGGEMSSMSKKRARGMRGPERYSIRALRGGGVDPIVGMCHEPSMKMLRLEAKSLLVLWASIAFWMEMRLLIDDVE